MITFLLILIILFLWDISASLRTILKNTLSIDYKSAINRELHIKLEHIRLTIRDFFSYYLEQQNKKKQPNEQTDSFDDHISGRPDYYQNYNYDDYDDYENTDNKANLKEDIREDIKEDLKDTKGNIKEDLKKDTEGDVKEGAEEGIKEDKKRWINMKWVISCSVIFWIAFFYYLWWVNN